MSRFTTEVRWICESKSGFTPTELATKSVDEIIAAARTNIFDFTWPSYNATWKENIEKYILKFYYTREIGFETVGLWKLNVSIRLSEIMDKYNAIISLLEEATDAQTGKIDYNKFLFNVDVETTGQTNTNGESKDKYSDTPQGTIANVDNASYLTDYRNIKTSAGQSVRSRETGYRGSKTRLELLRDSEIEQLDVLQRIALEMSDLFFGLWE